MKKGLLSIAIVMAISTISCKNEAKKETGTTEVSTEMKTTDLSFGVRGNCAMCKSTIEKAAKGVKGVASANWDVQKKKIEVSFDASQTDILTIHKAIAASGYDTEKVASSENAYEDLPGCCMYDHEMMMNQ